MTARAYEGVEVDVCESCKATWLDAGELQTICDVREQEFKDDERDRFFDELHARDGKKMGQSQLAPTQACPACSGLMSRLEYAYSSSVVIDRCPRCEGIFLEGEELARIQIWHEERDAYREHVREEEPKTLGRATIATLVEGLVGFVNSALGTSRY